MDTKELVTAKILEMMAQGEKAFTSLLIESANFGFPVNGKSGDNYKGTNVLSLWMQKAGRNYTSNIWLTYKQAQELGAQVKKGEKSTLCAYFDKIALKNQEGAEEGELKTFPMCKPFYLFNANQIDNLPNDLANIQPNKAIASIEDCETFVLNTGARFIESGEDMFYSRATDSINLPKLHLYRNIESYYFAKFHELVHWTGFKTRLNRDMGKRFGDRAYALEEGVASLGSALLAGRFGLLDAELENHAAYFQGWMQALEDDKTAIFTVCKLAFEAYDYLVALQEQQQEKEAA